MVKKNRENIEQFWLGKNVSRWSMLNKEPSAVGGIKNKSDDVIWDETEGENAERKILKIGWEGC